MRRCLVVANQTVGGDAFTQAIKDRIAAGECEFHVVVPATPPRDYFTDYGALMAGEPALPPPDERGRTLAEGNLDAALRQIREAGGTAEGEVGDPRPLAAVRAALADFPADEVLVSTLPPRVSRWLRQDLPSRVERTFGLPVSHIVVTKEPSRH